MHFLKPFVVLIGAVSATPLLVDRGTSAATLSADITDLDNGVKTLGAAIQAYTGGFNGIGAIVNAMNAVHTTNRKGYTDANAITTAFTVAESQAFIAQIRATLILDNPVACDAIKSKKKLFDQAFLSSSVLSSLKTLMDDHTTMSAAVTKWIAPSEIANANVMVRSITAVLQDAITYYS